MPTYLQIFCIFVHACAAFYRVWQTGYLTGIWRRNKTLWKSIHEQNQFRKHFFVFTREWVQRLLLHELCMTRENDVHNKKKTLTV